MKKSEVLPELEELYYVRNEGYQGNSLVWWAEGGHGYTCDLKKAWKLSKDQALSTCSGRRPTKDYAYPVSIVDKYIEHHVSSETLLRNEKPINEIVKPESRLKPRPLSRD